MSHLDHSSHIDSSSTGMPEHPVLSTPPTLAVGPGLIWLLVSKLHVSW